MNVVKEFNKQGTEIRIHDDYIGKENDKNIRELLLSLIVNKINNKNFSEIENIVSEWYN